MVSIQASLSNIFVSVELAREEFLKLKAGTELLERVMESNAPSFGRKKFLKLKTLDELEELGEAVEELPVNSKDDVAKIKQIILDWNHAVSGLKKYLMDILDGVRLMKLQVKKLDKEDKEEILAERQRVDDDLVQLAIELELYIKDRIGTREESQAYLDNPDPSISRMGDTYRNHLDSVMELVKEENFLQMLAKLRNLKSNPGSEHENVSNGTRL